MQTSDTLVSTEWLAARLDDPDLRVVDSSIYLERNPNGFGYLYESGRSKWAESHIPGAQFLDLVDELSDTRGQVRFMMPAPERFAEALGRHGIGDGHQIVIYTTGMVMWATRLWWMLRSVGCRNVAVLDGGFAKWTAEGRPVTAEIRRYPATRFTARPEPRRWADKVEMLATIGNADVCTINALSPETYNGKLNTYGRPGHIPDSHNVFYGDLLEPSTGAFKPVAELRPKFEAIGAFAKPRVVVYCGGGISATMDAMALTLAGHPDIAIYDGSMGEWVLDPALPLSLGDTP
jgi:thiosulfate/3-mercaptopyruvate sulfurtransferase